ncbi:MAG: MBL fold metallo-hydrolase, partial [Patescibacteria group bacterium]
IDVIIATHPDADHIGGLPEVMKRFFVGAVLEPGVSASTGVYDAFEKTITDQAVEKILARRGQRVNLGRGVILEILFPDRDPTGWETNTASIVAKLTYGDSEFLLTGDSPLQIEKYLLGLDGQQLRADVLKLGHHGSKTSSAPEFISAVRPTHAVISAGKNNRYGHPHQAVLDTLKTVDPKIGVLRTDELGTIIFDSDGLTLTRR